MKQLSIRLILLLLSLSACLCLSAQFTNDFEILYVKVDEKINKLVVGMEVIENPDGIAVNSGTVNINENIGGKIKDVIIDRIEEPENADKNEQVTILFLIDISGSMKGERIAKAKQAVIAAVQIASLPRDSRVYISVFDNETSPQQEITKENVEQIVDPIEQDGKDTDLFRSTIYKIRDLRDLPGKKILIALSDGVNDIGRNPFYRTHDPYSAEDVYSEAALADSNFFIFPVGLGNKTDEAFLRDLVASTPNPRDSFILASNPDFLAGIFLNLVSDFTGTYRLICIPEEKVYIGEQRQLIVNWGGTKKKEYKAGAANNEVDLRYKSRAARFNHWIILFISGLMALALSLTVLALLRPLRDKRQFKKKYVKNYVLEPGRVRRDPITQDPLAAGDKVVVKCQQVTLLSTWETLGQCPSYPACTEFVNPCAGEGAGEGKRNFFAQKGVDKLYNWTWFGAAGGFLAWILYAITDHWNLKWFSTYFHEIFNNDSIKSKFLTDTNGIDFLQNIDTMHNDALTGLWLGTCICFALSLVSEIGDSRKRSWLRVFMRVFLAAIIFLPLFTGGFLLQYFAIQIPFPAGLITWVVYGLLLGVLLSIKSNIELKKALLGGLIGAIVAYLVYFGIQFVLTDFQLAKLISYILMGAILGAVMVTIISGLEDFDLVVMTPSQFKGMVKPISKWLKKGMEVYIGSLSKCYVFIKWTDEAIEGRHAKLIYHEGEVFIEPIAETLVNGVILPMNERHPLKNDDIIHLGRDSITRLKYREKRVKRAK